MSTDPTNPRDQSRPLGTKQKKRRNAALMLIQQALGENHAVRETLGEMMTVRLTADGVRERAARVLYHLERAQSYEMGAINALMAMDSPAPFELALLLQLLED